MPLSIFPPCPFGTLPDSLLLVRSISLCLCMCLSLPVVVAVSVAVTATATATVRLCVCHCRLLLRPFLSPSPLPPNRSPGLWCYATCCKDYTEMIKRARGRNIRVFSDEMYRCASCCDRAWRKRLLVLPTYLVSDSFSKLAATRMEPLYASLRLRAPYRLATRT